jgi:hypothetical protein
MLVGMASACSAMEELRRRMAAKFGKEPSQLMLFLDPPPEPSARRGNARSIEGIPQ